MTFTEEQCEVLQEALDAYCDTFGARLKAKPDSSLATHLVKDLLAKQESARDMLAALIDLLGEEDGPC